MKQFLLAGVEVAPLAVLCVLAYLGERRRWVRFVTIAWLAIVLLGAAHALLAFSFSAIPVAHGGGADRVVPRVALGLLAAMAIGGAAGLPPARRLLGRFTPLDPSSFVHAVALVSVVALTLMAFVPLLVLGRPPLLMQAERGGGPFDESLATQTGYWLVWTLLLVPFAAGLGTRRDLVGVVARLGLRCPTAPQVLGAVAGALGLAVLAVPMEGGIDWLVQRLHWTPTQLDPLVGVWASSATPLGMVLIALSAGIGEEIVYRGLLQPRLGIVLSSLFFAASHALQYGWDYLFVILGLGFLFGWVRRRAGTAVSAILHGAYDFMILTAWVWGW